VAEATPILQPPGRTVTCPSNRHCPTQPTRTWHSGLGLWPGWQKEELEATICRYGPHISPKVPKDGLRAGGTNMIVAFLYIFAVLEVGYGIGILVGSQNEILGALAIGFSILTVGLASILMEAARSRALLERLARM